MPAIEPVLKNVTSAMDQNNGLGAALIIAIILITLGGIILLGGIFILLSICASNCSDRKKKKSDTEGQEEQSDQWRRQGLGEAAQRIQTTNSVTIYHATRRYEQFVGARAGWTKVGWDNDEVELQDLKKNGVVTGANAEEERGEPGSARRDSLSLSLGEDDGDIGGQRIEEWTTV
ncbi:hypothetical protein BDZ45DRAFT_692519 [Acephala macrosclerotiorum]|nr:hypothetical protein BDZ45DRAFT_692519 [Acephala macrosclerotiorum]